MFEVVHSFRSSAARSPTLLCWGTLLNHVHPPDQLTLIFLRIPQALGAWCQDHLPGAQRRPCSEVAPAAR